MAKALNSEQEMPKAYEPGKVEQKWYKFWLEKGYFRPKIDLEKKPFVIITHGLILLHGDSEKTRVNPSDYVLYHTGKERIPIGVISRDEFEGQYTDKVIEFCSDCTAKLEGREPEPKIELTDQGVGSVSGSVIDEAKLPFKIPAEVKAKYAKGETLTFSGDDGATIELKDLSEYVAYVTKVWESRKK